MPDPTSPRAARPDDWILPYLERVQQLPAVRAYKARVLDLLHVEPGMTVLEVGGGTGDDSLALLRVVGPAGRVVAVDLRPTVLRIARDRYARITGGHPMSIRGNVLDLPLADGSVDRCRADRVLQHVAGAERAVAEMARVLKPGGRLLVCDADWETLAIDHPDRDVTRQIVQAKADRLTNGAVGRALLRHCRDAGLTDVATDAFTLTFDDFELADAVFGLRGVLEALGAAGTVPRDVLDAWLDEARASQERGRFFGAVTGFAAWGTRVA